MDTSRLKGRTAMPAASAATAHAGPSRPVEVLTIGESMALFDPTQDGLPQLHSGYRLSFVGAESNAAIGLERLGVHTEWISRLGDDVFGQLIIDVMGVEGVDLHRCTSDPAANTGVMIKTRVVGETTRQYYRSTSAATRLQPFSLAPGSARWLHVTGITLGLSPSCRKTVLSAVGQAAEAGLTVSFDLNYRPGLWAGPHEARAAVEEILPHVDWLLCGRDEGELLFGGAGAADLATRLRDAGAGSAVIRDGATGAYLSWEDALTLVPIPQEVVSIADVVGAGDAFDAGFIFGQIRGADVLESIALGHRVAAYALAGTGDWETLPRREQLPDCPSAT